MKVTQIETYYKEVEYFGKTITVHADCAYMATDKDGRIYAFYFKPRILPDDVMWSVSPMGDDVFIGRADLGDTDWKDTLVEI